MKKEIRTNRRENENKVITTTQRSSKTGASFPVASLLTRIQPSFIHLDVHSFIHHSFHKISSFTDSPALS
jgi:hypothetical protein